jgi:hypothetical protein
MSASRLALKMFVSFVRPFELSVICSLRLVVPITPGRRWQPMPGEAAGKTLTVSKRF